MIDLSLSHWLNQPKNHNITDESISITTQPNTDFWQRSYYGFRNDNAPALLLEAQDNFTFICKVSFKYQALFDQCGLIIYLDSNNWFKASIEYENNDYSRLGSVVTNLGYSDWATTDIALPPYIWYRLSRRGPDFLIESSADGRTFKQMRVFHLHQLGETTQAMGKSNPPAPCEKAIDFGIYACSPTDSSFTATFTDLHMQPCLWQAHEA